MSATGVSEDYGSIRQRWDAAAKARASGQQQQELVATNGDSATQQSRAIEPTPDEQLRDDAAKLRFKAKYAIWIGVLLLFTVLHLTGLVLFTKGFLLTRKVLDQTSVCERLPLDIDLAGTDAATRAWMGSRRGCWSEQTFGKAVIVVIDALRYDFTVPTEMPEEPRSNFRGRMPVLWNTAVEKPHNAFLRPFIADPPTSTLQRLKGLMTGTLPTFIDAGSNFAGTAIEEDNLILQWKKQGRRLVQLGDDTWQALFPNVWDTNLTRPFDSFNVWDLHTVDNGVEEHLFPLLEKGSEWDIAVAHFLGVDHAGHRYGPDHPAMAAKLEQMDVLIAKLRDSIDDDTLLVVMGDHGMDPKGDHGGESFDEVQAALWMYSKKPIFGRTQDEFKTPPLNAKIRPLGQIDLVPTLALLTGIAVPYNNLGAPIEEAFCGKNGKDYARLLQASTIVNSQILEYQKAYAEAQTLDKTQLQKSWRSHEIAKDAYHDLLKGKLSEQARLEGYQHAIAFQTTNLDVFAALWARFDVPSMMSGLTILGLSLLLMALYTFSTKADMGVVNVVLLSSIFRPGFLLVAFLAGPAAVAAGVYDFQIWTATNATVSFTVAVIVAGLLSLSRLQLAVPLPTTFFGWQALLMTGLQSVMFFSNSFTIWEDEILLFFITSFGVTGFISSFRREKYAEKALGASQSLLFIVLVRLSSYSRLCREEQMPFCKSTYYTSSSSSTSAPWQLTLLYVVPLVLPAVIRSYYESTKSYLGPAPFWIGVVFRLGLLLSALFWLLDAGDDGDWLMVDRKDTLRLIKTSVSQFVLAIAFAAGTTYFAWSNPCMAVAGDPTSAQKERKLTVLGYGNVHGTRYFLLVVNVALGCILLSKPMGGLALALAVWQLLTVLETIDSNNLSRNSIGPVVLGMLGGFHFFKTGHQAALSSIQWEAAFIPLKTITYPWSPILLFLNTLAGPILATIALPLIASWKRHARDKTLFDTTVRAVTTGILYQATLLFTTAFAAFWLRRHLMLYRIFSPRFLLAAITLVAVDVVALLSAVAVWYSEDSVGKVLGYRDL